MKDIVVILRACDAVEAVNNFGKRPFCHDKKKVVRDCVSTLFESVEFAKLEGMTYKFYLVKDKLSQETESFLKEKQAEHGIDVEWRDSIGSGNVNSFKTCYNIALSLKEEQQLFLFVEDDYICDCDSISEIVKFYRMFDPKSNRVFINPTNDVGDGEVVNESAGKYEKTVVLPGSKSGIGIWWRQVFHSTSTFATNVSTIKWYKYVFDAMMKQSKLTQYIRNRIYRECPCFAPLYPLMEHWQKPKTMYWFDHRNDRKDFVYKSDKIFCRKDKQTVDVNF